MRTIKILLLSFAFCLLLIGDLFSAGSSCTVTQTVDGGRTRITWTWVSDSVTGAVSGGAVYVTPGCVIKAEANPDSGATQPSDGYDLTLTNANGVDMFNGSGANMSHDQNNAGNIFTPLSGSGYLMCPDRDTLTLNVTNAGNSKGGTVTIIMR